MAFKADSNIKPYEKKIWLSSPTMHGDELKYMQEAYETREDAAWYQHEEMGYNYRICYGEI